MWRAKEIRKRLKSGRSVICLLALSLQCWSVTVFSQGLVFVDLITFGRSDQDASSALPAHDILPRGVFFFSDNSHDIKLLAEFAANDKQSHFGRVKMGCQLDPSSMIWLGRTHNPASYWRNMFHHGGWLQPSITRPGIAEFEVPGGLVPSHSTGFMYEGGAEVDASEGYGFVMTYGYGSALSEKGLEVPPLIKKHRSMSDSSLAVRMSYHFESGMAVNEMGLMSSFSYIPVESTIEEEIEQELLGAYINWNFDDLRLISEAFRVNTKVIESIGTSRNSFDNAYVMLDYAHSETNSYYARLENTHYDETDIYLRRFSRFVSQRSMLGLRYHLSAKQLIKFEIERSKRFSGDEYYQASIQWSFIYP